MPMLLIKGSFHVSATAKPDGDTVAFIPDYVGEWKLVEGGRPLRPKADGHINVRLEAIDTLETHYPGANDHDESQPPTYARAAADELLTWLGFRDIVRHDDQTVSVTPDRVPGYILTQGGDSKGRCVALVGRGTPRGPAGTRSTSTRSCWRRPPTTTCWRRGSPTRPSTPASRQTSAAP
ncbi:hypothetical protein ACFQ0M_43840 [Kitasatospora aburaviensis]